MAPQNNESNTTFNIVKDLRNIESQITYKNWTDFSNILEDKNVNRKLSFFTK